MEKHNKRQLNLIETFLDSLKVEKGLSVNTVVAYRTDLQDLLSFLQARKPAKNLESATNEDILHYIHILSKKSFAKTTQSRRLSALKQFYEFYVNEKVINVNPTIGLKSPKKTDSLPKFLTENEILHMLNIASSLENKMLYIMLEVLYATGLRVSELVSLKISAFLVDDEVLLVKGKGSKERIVPLTSIAYQKLKEWLGLRWQHYKKSTKNEYYIFPSNRSTQGHISRERFAQLLKELAGKCNIDYKRVSPHVIRHSFASHLLNNGANLTTIQNMLGHADIATTEIYTHVLESKLQDAIFKNHPLSYKLHKGK
ncbi:site-specific tyrosine recombinase XerD [Candidatus Hepatincola sp. Pdp]